MPSLCDRRRNCKFWFLFVLIVWLFQTLEIAVQQEKQLEVCQTCGAFLIVGDAQQRIDDHLAGKQHVGYARIRQTLKEEEVCCLLYP